jgi:putative ABC transport system permease protein
MSLFSLALRHLRRHWRMNIAVLLGLTLAVALLASLPVYAVAVAARELDQDLQEARPTERNLLISGTRYTFNDELYEQLRASLGEPFQDRLVVRQATLAADPLSPAELKQHKAVSFLEVNSFDKLSDMVRLVEGRLPDQIRLEEALPDRPAPVEAIIGAGAAELTGYGVGDRLTANNAFHRLDIVGIVEPLDPYDDIWGEDLSAFSIAIDTSDPNVDTVTLPLIIASTSMRSNFKFVPIFRHSVLWRILLNHKALSVDNAQAFHADLINLQTQLGTRYATISTGLVRILADYLARLSHVRTTLFLLIAQAFVFVLYSLTILTSFVLERSQTELTTLSGRGASAWQITLVFALEYLILAFPAALLLGPVLAGSAMRLWVASSGENVTVMLPRESWLLSGLSAGLAWFALVVPVYPAARRDVPRWQGMRSRPPRLSVAQKLYFDLFLLATGALLYWQLNQSGSFVARRLGDTKLADPLLLVGPSLLLVAVAMVILRLFPYFLQLMAWAFQRLRGLMLPLGFQRLARDPLKPSRVVLLISLASGLILFTNSFGDSLSHSQEEMAHYLAGADLRVSLDQPTRLSIDQLTGLPGVLTVASVFRTTVQTESGQPIHLFAVDPSTFDQVARYPASLTDLKFTALMRVIQLDFEPTATEVPAVFSYSALPGANKVGDLVLLNLAGQHIPLGVRGSINNFPTLSGSFVIVSLAALEARAGLGDRLSGTREAWMSIDPAHRQDLIRHPTLNQRILGDTQVELHTLRSDALAQGMSGAFRLNTLTLALLSVAAFMLVSFFAAQGRVLEFGVLRAMGLSLRQLLELLVTEGVLVIALGLVAGTFIGYGMVQIMIPYLSQALSASLAGTTIKEILVDWPAIARMYLLLIACYGLALLLLLLVLLRAGVHQTLRIGDE